MKQAAWNRLAQAIFYTLGYFLLLEWLRPLEVITDIGNLFLFKVFLILPFAMYFLNMRNIWKVLILSLYIIGALHYLYYTPYSLLDPAWILTFMAEAAGSMGSLFQLNVEGMAYSIQTLMLFLLLWIMTYLIHYWVTIQRSMFLFFFLSVLYVTILDTFTPYDGDWAIVRLFVIGFLLLGCLTFYRLLQQERLAAKPANYAVWILPLLLFIAIGGALGLAGPKRSAQWPDPVPFIVSYSEKFNSGQDEESINKAGYSLDDSKLGGDFIGDNTVVFEAKVSEEHYWKVETKRIYTGSGWSSGSMGVSIPFENGRDIPVGCCNAPLETTDLLVDEVEVELPYVHLPYAAPSIEGTIISQDQKQGSSVSYRYFSGIDRIISSQQDGTYIKLEGYKLTYRMPIFDIAKLKEATSLPNPEEFNEYMEFPGANAGFIDLSRVQALAEEITKDKTNWYDKAKAIENYFDGPEFVYEQTDIPYPEEGQDFVEQFLFDTKRGYCDHYSTSMAVMLRTIGIPTRWVKGYTEGEYKTYENGKTVYQITNNNAHSWVEVYFSGTGWVPFEPTKGYANPVQFENSATSTPQEETETEKAEQPNQEKPEPKEERKEVSATKSSFGERIKQLWTENGRWLAGTGGAILIIGVILYALRRRWLPYVWIWHFSRSVSDETFTKAYMVLLKQLKRNGIKRKDQQTLREYAQMVDQIYGDGDMTDLTAYYERVVYGGEDAGTLWKQVELLWEKVMKKQ